jgi:hypothetical protein
MCGRFTLTATPGALNQLFPSLCEGLELTPSYNVAPTQNVLAVRLHPGTKELEGDVVLCLELPGGLEERASGAAGRAQGRLHLQRAGPPAWTTPPAARATASIPDGLQDPGAGPLADPYHPPRASHLYLARLGGRPHFGRSPRRRGPQQRGRHQRLPAYRGRRLRAGGQPISVRLGQRSPTLAHAASGGPGVAALGVTTKRPEAGGPRLAMAGEKT